MRLPALYRMLLREFWHLRGQAAAIAVVIGGGVATLVMSLAIIDTLQQTRDDFYRDYRFGHVFASLERAPESLVESLRAIPGVSWWRAGWWPPPTWSRRASRTRWPGGCSRCRTGVTASSTPCSCAPVACRRRAWTARWWPARPLPRPTGCARAIP